MIQVELFQVNKEDEDNEDEWQSCGTNESESSLFEYKHMEDVNDTSEIKKVKRRKNEH